MPFLHSNGEANIPAPVKYLPDEIKIFFTPPALWNVYPVKCLPREMFTP